jgi:ABC-2 type transport system permease protein
VNWQHLQAFLWLRWRLRLNQLKRGGVANAIVLGILAVCAAALAVAFFVGFFLFGLLAVPQDYYALMVLLVWDGLVVGFLFFWAVGLLAELQRAEVLSLDKFLHLPVSIWGAFLLNYLSSLFSMNVMILLPGMVGFILGLLCSRGPVMLVLLPLLAGFVLMVTAVTYQFQGWLAALMVNKRRRRTIIVVVTVAFILLCQLPNLINFWPNKPYFEQHTEFAKLQKQDQHKLQESLASGEITAKQYDQRQAELKREYRDREEELDRQMSESVDSIGRLVNLVLPPGWLPLGAMAAAEGNIATALLGTLGMTLIGTASLWRAYRTTVRLYTGQYTSGKGRPAAAQQAPKPQKPSAGLLEMDIPWLSEQTAAIALASFRSLIRAPEAKMMLLTPIIMAVVFGFMILTKSVDPPEALRPLMAFGGMTTALLSMIQLLGNQFGFDRSGFRVYVLCAAPRRDILLGKNLAFVPFGLGLATVMVLLVEGLYPMRIDHFLALAPQMISMYLLVCLTCNWLSMLAPMPIASGSFKPSNPKLIPVLLQLVFVFLLMATLSLTLLPLGIELLLQHLAGIEGIPICAVLSLAECAVVVVAYWLLLDGQGRFLAWRERRILEMVTTKAE